MAWAPYEIRNLPTTHSDERDLFPTRDAAAERPDSAPDRSWRLAETSSQASRSPESTRRKRLSFFGRSNADVSKLQSTSSLQHSTMPHENSRKVDPLNPPATIHTAKSRSGNGQGDPRKKTTDPLGSIRNSLFGGRKRAADNNPTNSSRSTPHQPHPVSKTSRSSHTVDPTKLNSSLIPLASPSSSNNETSKPKQDYQHRTKSSISPPFNFQHITHTAKKHLPRLETVDEKDLTAKFWAQHAYQRPKEKLVGIKANDLKQGQNLNSDLPDSRSDDVKQTRQVSSASQLIVSQGVTSGQGETAFDETKNAKIDSNDTPAASTKIRGEDAEPERPTPKRHSSSPEIHLLAQPGLTQQLSETISAQQSYLPTGSTKTCRASMPVAPMSTADNFLNRVPVGARHREHQPLPALPKDSKSTSKSPGSSRSSVTYSLFPTPPASNFDHLAYLKAKRSSVSGGTSTTGRSHSSSSWKTDVLNETTWEEDIDYAYEQEAEAECDFDWESTAPGGEETSQISTGPSPDPGSGTSSQGGGVRLSAWVEQPSALASTVSDGTTRSGSVDPGSPNDTHTHKRGSSVGHKGFLAARSASENTLTKSPAVSLEMGAATGKIPAPKLSLTEADLGPSSPCVPHNSSTVHIPTFDAGPEYLSDPESMPSSKHRKSSSYGSFDSAGHSLQRASDTTRWSSASTGSIPDLMHAKRKSKRSSARPLESVPHSPKAEEQDEDSLTVPSRAPHWDRERDPITMRRPATPGDRQILFSAGRHVQKGRNSAPTRINRNSPSASQEEVQTWI